MQKQLQLIKINAIFIIAFLISNKSLVALVNGFQYSYMLVLKSHNNNNNNKNNNNNNNEL